MKRIISTIIMLLILTSISSYGQRTWFTPKQQKTLDSLDAAISALSLGSSALGTGKIFIGDNTGVAYPRTTSGDITLSTTGVFGISPLAIVNADISASAAINPSKIDGAGHTISTSEFGALDGVTANIQEQIDGFVVGTGFIPSLGTFTTATTDLAFTDGYQKMYELRVGDHIPSLGIGALASDYFGWLWRTSNTGRLNYVYYNTVTESTQQDSLIGFTDAAVLSEEIVKAKVNYEVNIPRTSAGGSITHVYIDSTYNRYYINMTVSTTVYFYNPIDYVFEIRVANASSYTLAFAGADDYDLIWIDNPPSYTFVDPGNGDAKYVFEVWTNTSQIFARRVW